MSRTCLLCVVMVMCGVCVPVSAQDKPGKPVLLVAGFSIAKKDPKSEFGSSYSNFQQPGLNVDLYFEVPGQTVLSIDSKQTELALSADDGGELALREQFDGLVGINLREDKASGILALQSETLPGGKASRLKVDGIAALVVGKDLKTETFAVKLEDGATVKLGPMEATVGELGEAFGEPYQQRFSLSAKSSFDAFSKVEFLDAKGTVIESEGAGGGSFGFNDDVTYSQSYQIASDAKQVSLRVSWFTKTETIKLPVKLDFGLGL
jgi:hypothetical protein